MTRGQLFCPAFLSLSVCLLVTMGMEINSIPRHLSLNWEPQFFPCVSCLMLSVSFSFFLFPILLLLFSLQFCIMTCVQCPVSFLSWMPSASLWEAGDTPELPTREHTWICRAHCRFGTFGNRECYFRTAESLIKKIQYQGPWRLFKIRACLINSC